MFEAFLKQHDTAVWARTREALVPFTHEVDRDAARIWFHFFPLALAEAFARTDNPEQLSKDLYLEGNCRLADQSDTSHWFLFGHRYWPHVKEVIIERAESKAPSPSVDLAATIRTIGRDAASSAGERDESLLTGIAAVGLMTLQQVGLSAFRLGSARAESSSGWATKLPLQVVAARKRDDSQGVLGFLRGIRTEYSVRFDERRADGTFKIINKQHLTTAAANDTRDYSGGARRCQEGPIPIRCRSASCGSCWVGILGGAEKLSTVEPLEARRMKEFGYIDSTETHPIIRLACMAKASGNVTIVIPPWNGIVGKAGLGGA
jgi:ferredoxin